MQEMQRKECLHDKLLEMSGRNQDLSQWIPDMRWVNCFEKSPTLERSSQNINIIIRYNKYCARNA